MNEIWKAIPGFDGYEVSDLGQVRSYFKRAGKNWNISDIPQRILSQAIDSRGYKFVSLRKDGKLYRRSIHVLVTLAFIGERPLKYHVCHRDCNPSNNHLDNLRYDTPVNNAIDSIQLNRYLSISKLDNVMAFQIRTEYAKRDISIKELATKYNLSYDNIEDILKCVTYKTAGGPLYVNSNKLTQEDVIKIRTLYQSGVSLGELGKMYNRGRSSISHIVNKKRYAKL